MDTVYGSLKLRPTRIGFLVAPTNAEHVRRIMQVCTCLWGGYFNPIIPVSPEVPSSWVEPFARTPSGPTLAKGYIDFFEPDVFVECEPGLADLAGVAGERFTYGKPRVAPLEAFLEPTGNPPTIPFGLSVRDVFEELYRSQFQFVSRHDQRIVSFQSVPSSDPFVDATCGNFPSTGLLASFSEAHRHRFGGEVVLPTASNFTTAIREGWTTPLRLTRYGIEPRYDSYQERVLFFVDPESPTDLIELWNLRQFAGSVLPFNVQWAREQREFIREIVSANYRPLPGNPHGVILHSTVQFGSSFEKRVAEDLAKELLSGLPLGSWGLKPWYDSIWCVDRTQDHTIVPQRVRLSSDTSELELTLTGDRKHRMIRFPCLSPKFVSAYGRGDARWVNVLRLTYRGDERAAFVLPKYLPEETLVRLRTGGDGVLISREGIVLPQHFKNSRELLQIPSGTEAITEWLASRGIPTKVSGAGRIVDQVLTSVGGFLGASLLAHRETLDTLDGMARSVRRRADGVDEYPDRAKPTETWKALVAKRNSQSTLFKEFALDAFVKAKILRLGLELECPNCLNRNWCGIAEISEKVLCERCLERFDFPQGSLDFNHTPWRYRVVGPFAVPNYAGGAYGTVLALRCFGHGLGHNCRITFSPSLDLALDPPAGDVDFILWYRRDRISDEEQDTHIVFGEAKSFANQAFQSKEIQRMELLAKAVPGAFFAFATLKERLSEEEKREIGRFAIWSRERLESGGPRASVIVLTGLELFAEWSIHHEWENASGKHKEFARAGYLQIDNLRTLANATQQLYLDLPDEQGRFSS